MHVRQMLATLSSSEITEQLAASALKNKEFREEVEKEIKREKQRQMTADERAERFVQFFNARSKR